MIFRKLAQYKVFQNIASINANIKKRWLLVIAAYSIPFFLAQVTVAAYKVGSLVLLDVCMYAAVVALFVWIISDMMLSSYSDGFHKRLSSVLQSRELRRPETWLVLHNSIRIVELVAVVSAYIVSFFSIMIENTPPLRPYYLLWGALFCPLTFAYFHKMRNVLGMGFVGLGLPSHAKAKSFAVLASNLMKNGNRRGCEYLLRSLEMLKSLFRTYGLSLDLVDEAYQKLAISNLVKQVLPLPTLMSLCDGIARYSSMDEIPIFLRDFVSSEQLYSTRHFKLVTKPKSNVLRSRSLSFLLVLITAVGTLLQALIPENLKEQIVKILTSTTDYIALLQFGMVISLFSLSYWFFFKNFDFVPWRDLRQLLKAQNSKKSV